MCDWQLPHGCGLCDSLLKFLKRVGGHVLCIWLFSGLYIKNWPTFTSCPLMMPCLQWVHWVRSSCGLFYHNSHRRTSLIRTTAPGTHYVFAQLFSGSADPAPPLARPGLPVAVCNKPAGLSGLFDPEIIGILRCGEVTLLLGKGLETM